jgi:hypothetical protein
MPYTSAAPSTLGPNPIPGAIHILHNSHTRVRVRVRIKVRARVKGYG